MRAEGFPRLGESPRRRDALVIGSQPLGQDTRAEDTREEAGVHRGCSKPELQGLLECSSLFLAT